MTAPDVPEAVQIGSGPDGFEWWCQTCNAESGPFRSERLARLDSTFHDCEDFDA